MQPNALDFRLCRKTAKRHALAWASLMSALANLLKFECRNQIARHEAAGQSSVFNVFQQTIFGPIKDVWLGIHFGDGACGNEPFDRLIDKFVVFMGITSETDLDKWGRLFRRFQAGLIK